MSYITLKITNTLTEEQLHDRLPEIEHIEDPDLRLQVEDAFLYLCPSYFWEMPASTSGKYHAPENRGRHGLWSHTKMAFTVFERLADSYIERDLLSEYDADCVRAAILLHDMFKKGLEPELDFTSSYHDRLARVVLEHNTDLPEKVLHAVDCHNGAWYEGNNNEGDPDAPLQQWLIAELTHVCDMVASTQNVRAALYEPNAELRAEIDGYWEADY